jgi:Calpain family cysteine protease
MMLPTLKMLRGGNRRSAGSATTKAGRRAMHPRCEEMESRQLLSGITATLNSTGNAAYGPLNVLQINGSSGDDVIHLTQSGVSLSVSGVQINWKPQGWGGYGFLVNTVAAFGVTQVQIATGSGNDTVKIDPGITTQTLVFAGNGTDSLIAGGSYDTLFAGTGSDTLISIGGSHNTIFGGVGSSAPDSFWYDNGTTVYGVSPYEQATGMVHVVGAFATVFYPIIPNLPFPATPTLQLNGQTLPDPSITVAGASYRNFSGDPLFASGGPTAADVSQGQVGDCQFLSAVLGIVSHNPQEIRQMVVSLGDGTYAVRYKPGGVDKYVRVNADLPVYSDGSLVYSKLGAENSLWVALLEKAWTFERPTGGAWWVDNVGTYGNIDGGGPGELFGNMSIATTNLNSSNFFSSIVSNVNAGLIVDVSTVSSPTATSGLEGPHCYYVDHVNYTNLFLPGLGWIRIATSLTLRNPHGGGDSWVTVSAADINANLTGGIATTG